MYVKAKLKWSFFLILLSGHTELCSELTPVSAQGSPRAGLRAPLVVPGTELGLAVCKAGAMPTVLSLQAPELSFESKSYLTY